MRAAAASFCNRIWVKKSRPEWLWAVTLATAVYLVVEFAFNARLLDVIGGIPTPEQVSDIEHYGRTISGFAVALVFWGAIIERSRSRATGRILFGHAVVFLAISTAVIVHVVAFLEGRLVDYVVEQTTPETRRVSMMVVMLQKTLAAGRLEMQGFDLPKERMADPDGKAFLALYSPLVAQIPNLDEKLAGALPDISRAFADINQGGPHGSAARFTSALEHVQTMYDAHFIPGSKDYEQAIRGIPDVQANAWNRYVAELKRKRLSPNSRMSSRTRARVVAAVQQDGIPVPNGWAPSDKRGFLAAVATRARSNALDRFRRAVGKQLGVDAGSDIVPNMPLAALLRTSSVQAALRKRLGLPEGTYTLVSGNDTAQMTSHYVRNVYPTVIALSAGQLLDVVNKDAGQFAEHGAAEDTGKKFVRMMIVPSIALAFSVLGGLIHIVKLAFFGLQLANGRTFRRAWPKALAMLVLSFAALLVFSRLPTTDITSAPLYTYFKQQTYAQANSVTGRAASFALAFFSDAVIHAQPALYPVFEWTRVTLVGNAEFGYADPSDPEHSGH